YWFKLFFISKKRAKQMLRHRCRCQPPSLKTNTFANERSNASGVTAGSQHGCGESCSSSPGSHCSNSSVTASSVAAPGSDGLFCSDPHSINQSITPDVFCK